MKTNTKKIIAGLIAVVGAYFIYSYFKKPKVEKKPTSKRIIVPQIPSYQFPIKRGNKNAYVAAIQNYILEIDSTLLPKFGADGSFGNETEAAVQKLLGKKTIDSQADLEAMKK